MAGKKYLDDVGTEYLVEKINDKIQPQFVGTKAEWEALSADDKAKFVFVNLTDDYAVSDGWQEYVRNQNILSDYESVTISTTNTTAIYDGIINVMCYGSDARDTYVYVNDVRILVLNYSTTTTVNLSDGHTLFLKKGDTFRYSGAGPHISESKARWYKLRDYKER